MSMPTFETEDGNKVEELLTACLMGEPVAVKTPALIGCCLVLTIRMIQ